MKKLSYKSCTIGRVDSCRQGIWDNCKSLSIVVAMVTAIEVRSVAVVAIVVAVVAIVVTVEAMVVAIVEIVVEVRISFCLWSCLRGCSPFTKVVVTVVAGGKSIRVVGGGGWSVH